MAKPLSKLIEKISKEVDAAATVKAAEILAKMDFNPKAMKKIKFQ